MADLYVSKTNPSISVPATEGTVFMISGTAGQPRTVRFSNLDLANTLTWRFQSSPDASVWTDVAADATLPPGQTVVTTLQAAVFYRMQASGNLTMAVKVDAEVPFIDTFGFQVS